jgi:hypothetical protein
MKKENPETPLVPEAPVKPRQEKKEKPKKEKKKPQADEVQLPILVELTYSVSILFLIFVGLAMIVVSVLTGANLLNLILRTSAALLFVGSLVVLIFHQVSSGVLQASLVEQEEARKAQPEESENLESPTRTVAQETAEA